MLKLNFYKTMTTLPGLSLILVLILGSPAVASGYVDVGFDAGAFGVTDATTHSVFGRDVMVSGKLGFSDVDNNWEILAKVGHYQATSQAAVDVGKNFKLDITPLTCSLIHHFGDRFGMIQPYIGVGGDAYFYGLQDDVFGVLETGTRFGLHYLAGVRFNLNPKTAITVEYSQNYSPKPVYFDSAVDFNSTAVTLGLSFNLQPVLAKNGTEVAPEGRYQDQLLEEINTLQTEIKKMKDNRDIVEHKIDAFYENDDLQSSLGIVSALGQKMPLVGVGIKVIDPVSGSTLAAGVIASVDTVADKTRVTLKNTEGWMLALEIGNNSVSIGDKINSGFNSTNINSSITILTARDEAEFAKQLRTVQYLQNKLKVIDEKLAKAEAYLNALRDKWNQKPSEPVVHDTVVIQSDTVYHGRLYERHPHFYEVKDYVVQPPVTVSPVSVEEKEAYFKKKQEYIRKSKAR